MYEHKHHGILVCVSAASPMFRLHTMRLNKYISHFMYVVLAAEILTLVFIVYYIQGEVKTIIRMKWEYFKV